MAENNSVPLGQAGTGAAFVLGRNTAIDRLFQNEDYNTQLANQQALFAKKQLLAKQKEDQDNYIKNALNVKAGLVFPDINDRARSVTERGASLFQKGVNPWQPYTGTDPKLRDELNALQRDRMMVEEEAQKRDVIQPLLLKELTSFDPNKHTKESFDAVNQFSQLPASEAFRTQMPVLQPKLNPNEVLAKVKIAPEKVVRTNGNIRTEYVGADPDKARRSIVNQLINEPSTNAFLKEDLGIQGYDINALESLPKTLEGIKKDVMKEYAGNPNYRAELAANLGITNKDQFEQLADQQAIKAFQAKRKWDSFINEATRQKVAEVGTTDSRTYDFSAEREARARRGESKGELKEPTYRQDLLNRVLDKQEGSIEEMFDAVRGGIRQKGGTHMRGNDFKYKPNTDGTITVEIPDVIKQDKEGETQVVIPKTKIVIDPANRADAARKLNNVLNTYSDEKVATSALETPQGQKKVPQGQSERQFDKKTVNMVTMVLPDGRTGQIPSDKVSDFLKKYPKAKRR